MKEKKDYETLFEIYLYIEIKASILTNIYI